MNEEGITKEDLQIFRIQLMGDFRKLLVDFQKKEEIPEWLKSGEVRKILNVSPGTLQNLRINGDLHPVKISGSWYYNLSEIKLLFKGKR